MTITLIVPIYNKAPFLKRCLDSIKNQTVPFDEVILIDDCSTDGSAKIMLEYEPSKHILHTANKGVSYSRNEGIAEAYGDYICFLDADDALNPKASEIIHKLAERELNIIQFGQTRHYPNGMVIAKSNENRHWRTPDMPRYWQMAWNKLYKREFLKEHHLRFEEDMTFGEDEIFNVDAIMANNGRLWHAPQILVEHHLDDANSICRSGRLTDEDFWRFDGKLKLRAKISPRYQFWLEERTALLHGTKMFHEYGITQKGRGKHDIVYLLRDGANEELRYSLRSVDENFAHRKVWFVGGQPDGLTPDGRMPIEQTGANKFERVRNMLIECCKNDNITEDFWLFNDDFFVMHPAGGDTPQWTNGTLERRIQEIENRENNGMPTIYSNQLRHLVETLTKDGHPTLNYAVHKPMLINRKKALEVLTKYPHEPMFRALYGNYWRIDATDDFDCKIRRCDRPLKREKPFISTSDLSFNHGVIGSQLQQRFKHKSRFEE